MPDELNPTGSLEAPPTTTPEPEPEGVKEVQGEKVVPLAALVAERDRARTAEREKLTREYEPIRQRLDASEVRAQQLEAQLQALQAAHAPKEPDIPDISDSEAEQFARHYELYTPTGLDITRAKRLIKDRREEIKQVAQQVARETVKGPQEEIFRQASRQNFIWAANQRDANGQPLVDPTTLAQTWANLPAELTAKPEVAQHLLKTVAGEMLMSGKRPQPAPSQEPVFSETPGGRRAPFALTHMDKRMATVAGISEKDYTERAKAFQPGATNFLE